MKKATEFRWLFFAAAIFLLYNSYRKGIDLSHPVDLAPTWISGRLLVEGMADHIYGNSAYGQTRDPEWVKLENKEMGGQSAETAYVYLPLYLTAVLPFALFTSFKAFSIAFLILNALLLSLFLATIVRPFMRRLGATTGLVVLMLLCLSDSIQECLRLGQNIAVLAVLVLPFFRACMRKGRIAPALLMAGMVLIKPWAPIFVIYPILNGRWKSALWSCLGIITIIGLNFTILPGPTIDYFRLASSHSGISILTFNNLSVDAFLHKLVLGNWMEYYTRFVPAPHHPDLLSHVARGVLSALILLSAYSSPSGGQRRRAALALPLLFLNIFWAHYLILLLPLLVFLFFRKPGNSPAGLLWRALVLSVLFFDSTLVKEVYYLILLKGVSLANLRWVLPFYNFLPGTLVLIAFGLLGYGSYKRGLLQSPWRRLLSQAKRNLGEFRLSSSRGNDR
ncbi:MAG: DUF2029 domain-containing protein [Leptospiraceae bacterium]|nr:DUF2029 domain-containing protein [Leptospiraceae bacterium]